MHPSVKYKTKKKEIVEQKLTTSPGREVEILYVISFSYFFMTEGVSETYFFLEK